jgi:dihydrofolate reductase
MAGLRPAHVGGDRHEGVVPFHRWRAGCDRHKAREPAGERTVGVNVGEVGSQILAAGLVDEVAMDVVPVVFGSRERYFGSIDGQHLMEDPHVVIQGDRVLHLRFKVRR